MKTEKKTHETMLWECRRKMPVLLRDVIVYIALVLSPLSLSAADSGHDNVTLRTNFLYWATTTPNAGIDVGLGRHWSLTATFGYNAWNFPQRYSSDGRAMNPKLHHWLVMTEVKYWFDEQMQRHFLGVQLLGGRYNIGGMSFPKFLDDRRYEGWGAGAGISYGYQWSLGSHWGLEASLGIGYIYLSYDKYRCGACGDRRGSYRRHYVGPTKAAISLVYYLDGRKKPEEVENAPVPVVAPAPEEDSCADSIAALLATIADTRDALTHARQELTDARKPARKSTVSLVFSYPLNGDRIERGVGDNDRELARADSLMRTALEDGETPSRIRISGYASPEAEFDYNTALSKRRALALRDYIAGRYSLAGIPLYIEGNGEDWAGLRRMVTQRKDVPMRKEVTEIIDNIPVNEGREKRLMDLGKGNPYRWLMKHIFPLLRRVDLTVEYEN